MTLLVVLVEGVDVVLLPVPLPRLLGLRLLGDEVERVARRRPGNVGDRGGVMGERPRLAAGVVDEVDLRTGRAGVPRGHERDRAPIRGPPRTAFPTWPAGHLDRAAAVHVRAPDVAGAAARAP